MVDKVPDGDLTIRTIARPADTNPDGDIFGGWLVCQMDMAAQVIAQREANCRTVTAAIDALSFICPVKVGDNICCYSKLLSVGRTSMKIKVEVWTIAPFKKERQQVTEGVFTFVAIDSHGKAQPVRR